MPNFNDFEGVFLERFPERKEAFDLYFDDYDDQEDIGNYIILGSFILPILKDHFGEDPADEVRKLFDFFEDVARWDKPSEELIYIEVAEWLFNLADQRTYFYQYAGPIVRHAVDTIEEWNVLYRPPSQSPSHSP